MEIEFFDCNAYFGLPPTPSLLQVPAAADLLSEMDRNGVSRALIWHTVQFYTSPQDGNRLLAEAIQAHERLYGCWCILPAHTGEITNGSSFFEEMRRRRIAALRVFPEQHCFLLDPLSMGEWLAEISQRRIPLLVSLRSSDWRGVYDLMAAFPELTCVVCDHGCWGHDRYFRPLLSRYPNFYVDTSIYLLDGGIEALVADYGGGRLLFGSGFPEGYFGGMMLALKHAQIPFEAKSAIAGGNLQRLLSEVRW